MTLAELALLAGAEPKWVLNAAAALGLRQRYSLALARRLALAHALVSAAQMPLARAYELAGRALRAYSAARPIVDLAHDPAGVVALRLDVGRVLAAVATRQSQRATMYEPARRGRHPAKRHDPLRAAREYGIDLSLLKDNLQRTPAERLRRLDAMAAFRRGARRGRRRDAPV